MDKNPVILPLDPADEATKALIGGWEDGGKYTLNVTYSANPPQLTVTDSADADDESAEPAPDSEVAEMPEKSKSKNPAVAMLIANAGK